MSVSMDKSPKSTSACDYCRVKKDRTRVEIVWYKSCLPTDEQAAHIHKNHGEVCHFTPPNRRAQRKPREPKETHRLLQARLEKAEGLLRQAGLTGYGSQTSPSTTVLNVSSGTESASAPPEPSLNYTLPDSLTSDSGVLAGQKPDNACMQTQSPFQRHLQPANSSSTINTDTGGSRPSPHGTSFERSAIPVPYSNTTQHPVISPSTIESRSSIVPAASNGPAGPDNGTEVLQLHSPAFTANGTESAPEAPMEELHGPVSYLSICSKPGAEWVSRQIGASGFTDSAASFATRVYRNLKMQAPMSHARAPDPDPVRARSYAAAYFEQAFESAFDIIDRASFESRLTTQLEGGVPDNDPAWYALRNVVYAFGCGASTFKEGVPETWPEAQSLAWRFFENALAVHTELVYFRSNLSTVQALLVMSLFVEGMGNPKLEYMLISTTVRLAQSKGLHLQPAATSQLPPSEVALRSRLFWTMYFYEKHIAYRAGRPSMINDDDIDCKLPEPVPGQPPRKMEFFHHVIRHAQISSAIVDQLTTAKARRRKPSKTIETVKELDRRLKSWYETIPEALRMRGSQSGSPPQGLQASNLSYLHLAYFGSLAAIHSVFAYPWNLTGMDFGADVDLTAQVDTSTHALAEASRNIILSTRQLQISAAAPTWELFLYPIVGMINLFVYILKYPTRPSVSSDLGLLQMAAGYFGYLDYATSAIKSVPFVKDIVQLAQLTTKRVQDLQGGGSETLSNSHAAVDTSIHDLIDLSSWDEDLGGFNASDMGLDNWVCFLPSLDQVSSMTNDCPSG